MTNFNISNLPPELQARLAQIMSGTQAPQTPQDLPESPHQAAIAQPSQPIARQPSLMDHVISLRHEVAELKQQLVAIGQVTEAVGNATGQLYAMFQEQTQPSNFSTGFQENQVTQDDY